MSIINLLMSNKQKKRQHEQTQMFINEFSVLGLHGVNNYKLVFVGSTMIMYGENGTGKTTILNILNYVLTCDMRSLLEYTFESISISFANGTSVTIKYADLFPENMYAKELKHWSRRISPTKIREMYFDIAALNVDIEPKRSLGREIMIISRKHKVPEPLVYEMLYSKKASSKTEANIRRAIPKNTKVLFFPTYRKIEKNILKECNVDTAALGELSEIFGMDDVQSKLEDFLNEIRKQYLDLYSVISREMVYQFVRRTIITKQIRQRLQDVDAVDIVIKRLQLNDTKIQSKEIVTLAKKIKLNQKERLLLYFVSKMLELYDRQKPVETSLLTFTSLCSKFLINKKIQYRPDTVTIEISDNGKLLTLDMLSSGEKQLISLLHRLLFDVENQYILLIDEPELSMSIEWQKMFLPALLGTNKCVFLLAATHSPFIMQNELEPYAIDISSFTGANHA